MQALLRVTGKLAKEGRCADILIVHIRCLAFISYFLEPLVSFFIFSATSQRLGFPGMSRTVSARQCSGQILIQSLLAARAMLEKQRLERNLEFVCRWWKWAVTSRTQVRALNVG